MNANATVNQVYPIQMETTIDADSAIFGTQNVRISFISNPNERLNPMYMTNGRLTSKKERE